MIADDIPRLHLALTVNGKPCDAVIEPRELLVDVLRDRFGLKGTKRSCDMQVCGACTVLIDGEPARSCIAYAVACDGLAIETIEGFDGDPVMQQLREAFAMKDRLVFMDFVTDQTENVFPMVPGGKGMSEMILSEEL